MSSTTKSGFTTGGIGLVIPGITKALLKDNHILRGGGIQGYMSQATNDTDRTFIDFEQPRFQLRQAWNTTYPSQLRIKNLKRIITPFRAVSNSGDILSRKNYSCGGSCQSFQSRPNLHGLQGHFGAIHNLCDNTEVPAAACNTKYVYDASDYSTYLKQRTINRNYNDLSTGGDASSSSQVAWRAIRRY
jgi:hypothetical protein